MRAPTIVTTVFALLAASSPARINETREQCLARYGEPAESIPTRLEKSEIAADVFRLSGLKITIEYSGGKAWMITYAGTVVSKSVEKLLARNAEDGGWKSARFFDGQHWLSKKAGLHAVYYRTPGPRLVVMNEKSLAAVWKPRPSVLPEEGDPEPGDPDAPATPDPPKPPAGKPDVLDGL